MRLREAPVSTRKRRPVSLSLRCNSLLPVEAVFIIHWRRGRFPPEGPARCREPGSDGQPLRTADGNSNSLVGGGVLGSGCGYGQSGRQTAWRQ